MIQLFEGSNHELSVEEWLGTIDSLVFEGLRVRGLTYPPTPDHLRIFQDIADTAQSAIESINQRKET